MSTFGKNGFISYIDDYGREVYEKNGWTVTFDHKQRWVRFSPPVHSGKPGHLVPFGMMKECVRVIERLEKEGLA